MVPNKQDDWTLFAHGPTFADFHRCVTAMNNRQPAHQATPNINVARPPRIDPAAGVEPQLPEETPCAIRSVANRSTSAKPCRPMSRPSWARPSRNMPDVRPMRRSCFLEVRARIRLRSDRASVHRPDRPGQGAMPTRSTPPSTRCCEKMDKQLRRYKRRLKDHHKARPDPVELSNAGSYILAPTDEDGRGGAGTPAADHRGRDGDEDPLAFGRRGGDADGAWRTPRFWSSGTKNTTGSTSSIAATTETSAGSTPATQAETPVPTGPQPHADCEYASQQCSAAQPSRCLARRPARSGCSRISARSQSRTTDCHAGRRDRGADRNARGWGRPASAMASRCRMRGWPGSTRCSALFVRLEKPLDFDCG